MARWQRPLAAVAAGGALGALARWAVVGLGASDASETITMAVNVAGSLLLGLLYGFRERLDPDLLLGLGTGFAGGFTTFSTYAVAVATHLDDGDVLAAAANGLGTPIAAVLAAGLGYRSSRLFGARPGSGRRRRRWRSRRTSSGGRWRR
ncbi:MAG: CrcB family protein [Actinomycetota bacterium]